MLVPCRFKSLRFVSCSKRSKSASVISVNSRETVSGPEGPLILLVVQPPNRSIAAIAADRALNSASVGASFSDGVSTVAAGRVSVEGSGGDEGASSLQPTASVRQTK